MIIIINNYSVILIICNKKLYCKRLKGKKFNITSHFKDYIVIIGGNAVDRLTLFFNFRRVIFSI